MDRKWMQTSKLVVVLVVTLAVSPVALGQSPGAGEKTDDAADQVIVRQEQTPSTDQEPGVLAVDRAAKANKYAFIFFFRTDDKHAQAMRTGLESAVAEIPDQAEAVTVDLTDPLEKAIVDRFDLSRSPMPLILAVAPTGAITKHWFRRFDGKELEQAFVSPAEAQCLKALQDRKMVLVSIQNGKTAHNQEAMRGVNEFKADRLYAAQTALVSVDPTNEAEADFLKTLGVTPETEEAVTVLMAPPGRPIATFTGATKKAAIVAATKKAGSKCDPKSGCCSSKKKASKKAGNQKPSQKKP